MNEDQTPPAIPDAQVIFEHASRLASPLVAEDSDMQGAPAVLIPRGWTVAPIPGWEPKVPSRIQHTITFGNTESFCRYLKEFAGQSTRVFGAISKESMRCCAILDFHDVSKGQPSPNWCSHRAIYTPEITENWAAWARVNGRRMTQTEFAQFLEENAADVVSPEGADLLAIVNTIEVDGTVQFRKAMRQQDGSVLFSYNHEVTARSGEISIPSEFVIRVPIYIGEPAVDVRARLRYRLTGNELCLWFDLIHAPRVVRASSEALLDRIRKETGLTPYVTNPSAQFS